MHRVRWHMLLLVSLLVLTACGSTPPVQRERTATPLPGGTLRLQEVYSGLEQPVYMTDAPDGSGRHYIVEQAGRILVADPGGPVRPTPVLDIRALVASGGERGLLSMAFSPEFRSDRAFFVDYTDRNGDTVVARYQLLPGDPYRADAESARRVLFVRQPAANHNGGLLLFGPDRMLYVGMGDGGGGASGNGQRRDTLLGKLLRLDVLGARGDQPYAIPADNPFVGRAGIRGEIWAYGLRNPWRFSFDRQTGDLWIADVGAVTEEEIDFQPRASRGGENYGWAVVEGRACLSGTACDQRGMVAPVATYGHTDGNCTVVGGYVYRGQQVPWLRGQYLYGDFCSGAIWALDAAAAARGQATPALVAQSGRAIASFAEDAAGEVYVVDLRGSIARVVG